MLTFGSVCSGIEAASVAWAGFDAKPSWFAEIEAFPSSVLAHHYPDVPNLGDMTRIAELVSAGVLDAPDVLVGGTPCQSFSLAGLRAGLSDPRGGLTLAFVELADAIDGVRDEPCVVVWENVPGVLSSKDNAFGCFLAGLAGEDEPLIPAGSKWSNAGVVLGPQRAVAWRVLDAQYFGVAQRRRRVFVVASARKGFDPATVLFEWDGVRRDTAPSREARQVAPTIPSRSTAGGGLGTDFDCDGGLIAHTLRGEGFDASEDGTGRGTPLGPVAMINMQGSKGNAVAQADGPSFTLNAMHGHDMHAVAVPVGVTIHGTDPTVQKVDSYDELAQCLRARTPGNIDNSSSNGWGIQEEVTHTLDCAQGVAVAFHPTQDPISNTDGTTHAMGCGSSTGQASIAVLDSGFRVRRLMPVECERLQGFPDGHTLIKVGKNVSKDGQRYKALGNSMAVPVMRWIGNRVFDAMQRDTLI